MSAVLKKSTAYGGAIMTLDTRGRLVLDSDVLKTRGGYELQFKAAKRLGAALAKKRKKIDRANAR